jgi:hypothetical protein
MLRLDFTKCVGYILIDSERLMTTKETKPPILGQGKVRLNVLIALLAES